MHACLTDVAAQVESSGPAGQRCPSCGGGKMSLFYTVQKVPVHSNLMQRDAQAARDFPIGDLHLSLCEDCGFISNTAYDAAFKRYSPIYEDQQSFSQTFHSFSDELVDLLIKKHALHNRDIIEIGCGKGDFLVQLCERGDNRGIGIDPAVIDDRVQHNRRVHFVRDYYSEKYGHLKGDVYICRHTLEHIDATGAFLRILRRSIGDRRALVFFEVPDVLRVLQERAFWDVYYEHCSYFSAGSLARSFRRSGFQVTDLWLGYDDQYLLIEAQPAHGAANGHCRQEESLTQLKQEVADFTAHIKTKLKDWRDTLERFRRDNKKIAIWGSGSKCVAFLTTLKSDVEIDCIVDINPHRHFKFIPGLGLPVSPPATLRDVRPDVLLIMNPIYEREIAAELYEMDLQPLLLCL
ncbi:methyltransferase domain-containing protein [candidate division KSB1 bacterium]|nr:methyltransferase domain-containing protein [candidate division KSB1 bacterium]RQW10704.1 MAG: methyltransferase domain-containing protein [candidate division KSB1 bacterium]